MVKLTAAATVALCALAALGEARESRSLMRDRKVRRSMSVMQRKEQRWASNRAFLKELRSVRGEPQPCVNGEVVIDGEAYTCNEVDFLSLVASPEMRIDRPGYVDEINELADMWGWLSPTGREINIVCLSNGVRFIDSTDPTNPLNLGFMPSNRPESYWCDVKVYKDTAFVVKDRFRAQAVEPTNGIHVFNLTRLESNDGSGGPVEYQPDYIYDKHGNAHNVVMNTETGFLYSVGTGGDECNSGLHVVDVREPLKPKFVACAGEDAYVHDAQCLIYSGPDKTYKGREICIGFDEDTFTIFDVEDKNDIKIVSRTGYFGAYYTHQGWLNDDQDFLLLDDELDELDGGQPQTRTFIFDVNSLEHPVITGYYDHPSPAIDHNLYVFGEIHKHGWGGSPAMENPPSSKYAYHSNYCSGLRVVDIQGIKNSPPTLKEVGFFDVSPDCEIADWYGSWSTYMHPSGVMGISCIERGFFLVKPKMAFTDPALVAFQEGNGIGGIVAGVFIAFFAVLGLITVVTMFFSKKANVNVPAAEPPTEEAVAPAKEPTEAKEAASL